MEKNYLVSKANDLITANYDLSLEEQRVILTLASTIQPDDEEFKPYKFRIKDFMSILGIKTKTKYTEIPKITKNLMKKVIEIKKDNKILQVAWLSSAEYEISSGTVELQFSPKLKPYFLKLKKLYTSYRLENILSLKSKYSIRIYELLKSNQFKGYIIEDLEALRNMVGATEYIVYANFKSRILKQSQKEINAKTDLNFDFEEIKTGRKVTSIKFIIRDCEVKQVEVKDKEIIKPKRTSKQKTKTEPKQTKVKPLEEADHVISIMDNLCPAARPATPGRSGHTRLCATASRVAGRLRGSAQWSCPWLYAATCRWC